MIPEPASVDLDTFDLAGRRHVHFVGVGGAGMSALASVLAASGQRVSGCDLHRSAVTDDLERRGVAVHAGHDPSHLDGVDLVAITSAMPADTPELVAARQRGVTVIKRAELLGILTRRQQSICVAGTHGKTTTSAMIGLAAADAGRDPTILVGGTIPRLRSGARLGRGDLLVAEADEYDGSFLRFRPTVAVVLNVEPDHLDFYGTMERMEAAFAGFMALVPPDGARVVCADDARALRLAERGGGRLVTYGLEAPADWRAADVAPNDRGGNDAMVLRGDLTVARLSLAVPGRHNVADALAAVAAADVVGIEPERVAASLRDFTGVRRRFERRGEAAGVAVYDDYAHHPTEIRAILRAARERRPARLWAVFQPHTYHRTASLFDEFAAAFSDADWVVIVDVYSPAGREQPDPRVHSSRLVAATAHPGASYQPTLADAAAAVAAEARPGDLVLTIGAGTITTLPDELLARLRARAESS